MGTAGGALNAGEHTLATCALCGCYEPHAGTVQIDSELLEFGCTRGKGIDALLYGVPNVVSSRWR